MSKKLLHFVLATLILGSLIAADGGCGNADLEGAKLYLKQGNAPDAIAAAEKAIVADSTNGEAYYILGKAHFVKENYAAAAKSLKSALSYSAKMTEADRADTKNLLAEVWRQEYNGGASLFNQAYTEKADEGLRKELLLKAVDRLNSAISISPDSAAPYRALSNSQVLLKDYKAATATLQKALEFDANDTLTYVQLSTIYAGELKDTAKAIATLETAYQKNLRSSEVTRLLVTNYFLAKRNKEAEALVQKALQTEPENLLMLYLYGVLLNEKKDYAGAIKQFEKVISKKPDYLDYASSYNASIAYFRLAEADEDANKPKEKKRGKKEPEYTGHYKFYESAIAIMKPAAEASKNKDFFKFLGQLYARVGKNAEASEALAKSK